MDYDQKYNSTTPTDATPPGPQAPVPWSSGICHCGDNIEFRCITCWCPCITFGQISEIIDKGSPSCTINGVIYGFLRHFTGFHWLYACSYRSRMRQEYNLNGSSCGDCFVHCCCEPCALRQEYRELESRGFDMSIGWHGNVERQNRGVAMPPIVEKGMTR
ncbi:hypothetical protein NE237_021287 [Protea cynaroides]|uniref:Uncharacterized protein n=1 Tax=Protea cynaroides TaxID=273540 RepID=A0A9Q0HC53_9MAGN|nr:hypothetical protein NE237_021287 [Protea cynaroides]